MTVTNERRWLRRSLSAVSLFAALAVMVWAVLTLLHPETLPMRAVQLEGDFKYMQEQDLQKIIAPYATGGFFTVDIGQLRAAVYSMTWVDDVSVRRVWPDRLVIRVREHEPLAKWGNTGLLNVRGEFFAADQSVVGDLPVLHGPKGFEQILTQRFHEVGRLLEPVGLVVAGLYIDQRRSWRVALGNKIELRLGRTGISPRLTRFVRIYPQMLAARAANIKAVDLRYTNGFAVQWKSDIKAGFENDVLQKKIIRAPTGVSGGMVNHV